MVSSHTYDREDANSNVLVVVVAFVAAGIGVLAKVNG